MDEIERLVIPKFESAQKENNCGALLKETTAALKSVVAQVLHLCLLLLVDGLPIFGFHSAYLFGCLSL